MAEVWLAKRADGAFKREVALELLMVSRPRKDLQERSIMCLHFKLEFCALLLTPDLYLLLSCRT
jgi:hypothetical protein